MEIILETGRLILRELNTADAENLYRLNQNPEVIKYTGNAAFHSINEAKSFLENYSDYQKHGYGRWEVIKKGTYNFIGWCGLKYGEIENETDIGFRFFACEWNKGYATESAAACLKYGMQELNLHRIIGRAMKENISSINVLQKIGLKYEKDTLLDGKEAVLYKIEKLNRESV